MDTRRSQQAGHGRSRRWRWRNPAKLALAAGMALLLVLAAGACGSSDEVASERDPTEATVVPVGPGEQSDEAAEDGGGTLSGGEAPDTTIAESADTAEEAAADSDAPAAEESEARGEGSATGQAGGDSQGSEADQLGAGGAAITQTAADLGRKLIFTAQIHVGVDDVAAASADATSIIEDLGGFVFGQNTVGGAEPSSELVFKVLPDDFNRALEQLGTVGELRNQTVTTDDVTERVVDLESRIQVADLGVARLRAALEGAATLEDYGQLEQLLLNRESELEVMRGELRTLQDRIDLATITLLLTQDRVENAIDIRISAYENHDNGESCPGEGGLTTEAGSDVTVCFDIINLGDQTLTGIVLTDTVLEISSDTQLIEVFGSLDQLAPGQSALVAYEITPEHSLRPRPRVVAIPTDGVSLEQVGPSVTTQVEFDLRTFAADRAPGFGDGFSVAVGFLKAIWIALGVTVGFLIPLLLLLPIPLLAWWAWRRLPRRQPPAASPPPPPAASPPPPPAGSREEKSPAAAD